MFSARDACEDVANSLGLLGVLFAPCPRIHFPEPARHIKSEHEADARHPIVAAASILAKVERDRIVAELAAEHGDIGSGYSHDQTTRDWLETYVKREGKLPPIARHHWETARRLIPTNRTLLEYE